MRLAWQKPCSDVSMAETPRLFGVNCGRPALDVSELPVFSALVGGACTHLSSLGRDHGGQ